MITISTSGAALAPSVITGLFAFGAALLASALAWLAASRQAVTKHEREINAENRRRQIHNVQDAMVDFAKAAELCRQVVVNVAYRRAQAAEAAEALTSLMAARTRVFMTASQEAVLAVQEHIDDIRTMLSLAEAQAPDWKAFDAAQLKAARSFTKLHNAFRKEAGLEELALADGILKLATP